jgi:hypothetical protein
MQHSQVKHKRLYALLNEKRLMDQRHQLFQAYSGNRTDNSKELQEREVDELIRFLQAYSLGGKQIDYKTNFQKGDKMRKRILSLCYEYGWTKWNNAKGRETVDFEKLNGWMIKYSYLHKRLNQYSYSELPALVTQFESVIKSFLNSI